MSVFFIKNTHTTKISLNFHINCLLFSRAYVKINVAYYGVKLDFIVKTAIYATKSRKKLSFIGETIMKMMKKLGALLLAGALTVGVGALTACGGDDATAYTLIVKDADGNAMKDYYITICEVVNGEKTTCLPPQKTDANGKVVFEVAEGSYAVSDANTGDDLDLQTDYYLNEYGTTNVVIVTR